MIDKKLPIACAVVSLFCLNTDSSRLVGKPKPSAILLNQAQDRPIADSHFHVRNFIQEGITLDQAYELLLKKGVKRAAVFGIPLQQRWDMETRVSPSYYLHDDQSLYYYSAIDAIVASEYQLLPKERKSFFDPMIVGFNPTDGRAIDHIKNMLLNFPGTFSGIGEFAVKKEIVSSKISGEAANLEDPALGLILEFASEVGLVVIFHSDIDAMISNNEQEPTYLKSIEYLFDKHQNTKIIWAHTGLGRYVKARKDHTQLIGNLLDRYENLFVDISWDLVVDQFFDDQYLHRQWKTFLTNYAKRILFGTDAVAPSLADYEKTLNSYERIWQELSEESVQDITYNNYKKIFDEARLKVRLWEEGAVKQAKGSQ